MSRTKGSLNRTTLEAMAAVALVNLGVPGAGEASATPADTSKQIKKDVSYTSLETFETVTEKITITFQPALNYADAVARMPEESEQLAAINARLQKIAVRAETKAVEAKGVDSTTLFTCLRPFRQAPQFASILKKDANGDVTSESYAAQTKAMLEWLKSPEGAPIKAMIVSMSESARATEDVDES